MDIQEVFERKDPTLIFQAEEYLSQKIRTKIRQVEKDQNIPVRWNLSSGDHSEMVTEERGKAKSQKLAEITRECQQQSNKPANNNEVNGSLQKQKSLQQSNTNIGDMDDIFDGLEEDEGAE